MVNVKLNRKGVAKLLKSQGVADAVKKKADRIAAASGDGYESSVKIGRRARASVATVSRGARADNSKNATLLKNVRA